MSNELSQRKALIIARMVASLRDGQNRGYYVGLVGYFIEGDPCAASGLSVDLWSTRNIRQTRDGFVCDAFFPPEQLQPETVEAKGIIKKVVEGKEADVVPVSLEVNLDDIWSVVVTIDGVQHTLIVDEETVKSRVALFTAETEEE